MTSFATLEASREGSRPIETYTFDLGGEPFLYTSSGANITRGLSTFEATAIRRSEIAVGRTERRRPFYVEVPNDNELARLYVLVPPSVKATLRLDRLQRDESPTFATAIPYYEGSVKAVEWPSPSIARLVLQTEEANADKHLPRYSYMGVCNHVHYGPGCQVDPTTYQFTGTVTAASGRTITVSGLTGTGRDFKGGFVLFGGKPRVILKQVGDVITLLMRYPTEAVGASVTCLPGCNHRMRGDCALVYDNVINVGAFAYVPKRNVFQKGLLPP